MRVTDWEPGECKIEEAGKGISAIMPGNRFTLQDKLTGIDCCPQKAAFWQNTGWIACK